MKALFARNLSNTGRRLRGLGAMRLLIAAGVGFLYSTWLGVVWTIPGVLVLF